MNHEDDGRYEPTRFAWVYDGLLVAGTLSDWAKQWEGDYYAGDVPPPLRLITWDGSDQGARHWMVSISCGEPTQDDYIPYMITVPGLHDIVIVTVDGRH